ncbi:hypothetical protein GQ55_1G359800 [Panicum hallii var. hallii]|uniref:Uncharacterized protein n=1 Tax=Panicum hallii var. hallii TaxID=1504633 RepID=A0A2T7FB45_9POAL|nr:hypothetical protein GQ55_1G359800 [Panicum hallii var. hallii]
MGIRGSFVHVSKGGEHWQWPVNSSRTLLARPRLLLHRIGVSSRVAGSPPRMICVNGGRPLCLPRGGGGRGRDVIWSPGRHARGPAGQNFTSKT